MSARPIPHRPNRRFALGAIDPADGDLVQRKLARSLGNNRFHDHNSLHASGELCAPRGGVLVRTVVPRQRIARG